MSEYLPIYCSSCYALLISLASFISLPSRFSHAEYSLGNFTSSIASYTKGLTLDPTNKNMLSALAQAKTKAKESNQSLDIANAPKSSGGEFDGDEQVKDAKAGDDDEEEDDEEGESVAAPRGGASGGAGGMPDLSALAGMFGGGGAGGGAAGGMPDLAGLMQNPMMMQM